VRATEAILEYIRNLKHEGVSSVLATHNLYHAYQVCDRFVVMGHGRVAQMVTKDDTIVEGCKIRSESGSPALLIPMAKSCVARTPVE
jgi:ABC-type sugar transport system ATPase subunit